MTGFEPPEVRTVRDDRVYKITLPLDAEVNPVGKWVVGEFRGPDKSILPFGALANGKPWQGAVPVHLELEKPGARWDLTPTVCMVLVTTSRAADVLRPHIETCCEFVPVEVEGLEHERFFAMNVLAMLDALDEARSSVSYLPEDYYKANPLAPRHYHKVRECVFREEAVTAPMFRLAKAPPSVYIRHDLHEVIVEAGLSGIMCRPMRSV